MSEHKRPAIELPCSNYPIKVIGDTEPEFRRRVETVLQALQIDYSSDMKEAPSRNGRFLSLTILITAENEQQLSALNTELRQLDCVRMVL